MTTTGPMLAFSDRPSDSPLVERVWQSSSTRGGEFQSIAACHWEIVAAKIEGQTSIIVRGPETMATRANCPADGEWFAIRFKLGTYLPLHRPRNLQNRKDLVLPNASRKSFWLNGSAWEIPTYENADVFVARMVRAGLLANDPLISAVLRNRPRNSSTRTEERRIREVTGLTRGTICQIERARAATLLLRSGKSIADVTYLAGYYDQPHLTRSLKRWIGLTPLQIARWEEQLSFLYKMRED